MVVEKEMAIIIKTVLFFRSLLLCSKLIINSVNKNLLFQKDLSKRIERWKLLLSELSYKIIHIKGTYNFIADTISRIFPTSKVTNKFYLHFKEIKEEQDNCSFIKKQLENKTTSEININGTNLLTDLKSRLLISNS